MNAIEPNSISLIWFSIFAIVCALAFLVVAGMFPLDARPAVTRSSGAMLLIFSNVILLAVLLIGTGVYGYTELRWSTLIVVAGLTVLFAPGLFQLWPPSSRDGKFGLIVMVGIQSLALATLAVVARPSLPSLS
jgi:hypothetical protein